MPAYSLYTLGIMNRQTYRKYILPIQVRIEWRLNKIARFIDRLYARILWKVLFGAFLATMAFVLWGAYTYDRQWYREFANIDESFSATFTTWNTDGKPGQEPPKK